MATVQLQCGSCKKLMAIGVEHLGGQVQCPHCRSVVQTPAAPAVPNMDLSQPESIFSDQDAAKAPTRSAPPDVNEPPASATLPAEDAFEPLPKFKPRPIYDRSFLPVIALIFLVPYAFFTTLFILYLIFFAPSRTDPLEFLRDPVPEKGKGGPKRVERMQPKHDQPLGARLKTTLGKPIQAGDLLVTPTRVRLTAAGDLQLLLRARNTAADTAFEPVNELFVKLDFNKLEAKPYTFVESKARSVETIYGQYLEFHMDVDAKDKPANTAVLSPNGEVTISLTTYEKYRPQVASIAVGNDAYLWRVRVRRGFVKVDRNDVSATTVIGVEFSSGDIEGKKS